MDKLRALSIYTAAYRAKAEHLAASVVAREWMESMTGPGFRDATEQQLKEHAEMAATWASAGFVPAEALPLIASGMTVEMATAMDPTTEAEMIERVADEIEMLRRQE